MPNGLDSISWFSLSKYMMSRKHKQTIGAHSIPSRLKLWKSYDTGFQGMWLQCKPHQETNKISATWSDPSAIRAKGDKIVSPMTEPISFVWGLSFHQDGRSENGVVLAWDHVLSCHSFLLPRSLLQ
uniref:Uncharacterized protein n=1 Tax=Eutreptiella gymnastica TaxID=73025 RepID=A0A7S4L9S2_9EUGL